MVITVFFRNIEHMNEPENNKSFKDFYSVYERRMKEADEFFAVIQANMNSEEERRIQRQLLPVCCGARNFY